MVVPWSSRRSKERVKVKRDLSRPHVYESVRERGKKDMIDTERKRNRELKILEYKIVPNRNVKI